MLQLLKNDAVLQANDLEWEPKQRIILN